MLLPLACPPEPALDTEELEEDRDPDLDLDLLDAGVELRDLDREELRDFDLDLSESESELEDNLDCLLETPILDLILKLFI